MGYQLPGEIVRFIGEMKIRNMGQLEVLLLLWRNPSHSWTVEEVALNLRSNSEIAQHQLNDLLEAGLLTFLSHERSYKYQPKREDVRVTIDLLAELYNTCRSSIINHIYAHPNQNIRRFAEAFVIRKE